MPIEQSSPAVVARAVADLLERSGIPYALGGALAYNEYGVFRTTLDVDFNVFLPTEEAEPVLVALQHEGLQVDIAKASKGRSTDVTWWRWQAISTSTPLHRSCWSGTRHIPRTP